MDYFLNNFFVHVLPPNSKKNFKLIYAPSIIKKINTTFENFKKKKNE